MSKIIITGGPGSGKSTLIEALKPLFYCSEEVSRRLIREEVEKDSSCLPWINMECFAEKALDQMVQEFQNAPADNVSFFDRGIPDIMAYLKVAELTPGEKYSTALSDCYYHKNVFLLPPWKEIYVNDSERWQSFDESERISRVIFETYLSLGYNVIELPKCSVSERKNLILQSI